eukprot:g4572.t1
MAISVRKRARRSYGGGAAAGLLAVLAASCVAGVARGELENPNPEKVVLANAGRLQERKVKARDYRLMHCHDTICNLECAAGRATCPFNVAGFESVPMEGVDDLTNDEDDKAATADMIQTIASTFGAPVVGILHTSNMSVYQFSPARPTSNISFWTSIEDKFQNDYNVTDFQRPSTDRSAGGLAFPNAQLAFADEDQLHLVPRYMTGAGIQFEKIIEYEDVAGTGGVAGQYDPRKDRVLQTVNLEELAWLKPVSETGDFDLDNNTGSALKNVTKDEQGLVRSHFRFANARSVSPTQSHAPMPAGAVRLDFESANMPFRPSSQLGNVSDAPHDPNMNARIVTPNNTRVRLTIENFPYQGNNSRLALTALIFSSGTSKTRDPIDDAFVRTSRTGFENVYVAGRASHRYKYYMTWTPYAMINRAAAEKVRIRSLTPATTDEISYSIFKGTFMYGSFKGNEDGHIPRSMVFSLGDGSSAKEGGGTNPQQIVWDFALGYGFSPLESFFNLWWLV